MQTQTHYTDAAGQHELPLALQNRTIEQGDVLLPIDDWEELGADEVDEIRQAVRGLGVTVEVYDDGLTVESVPDDEPPREYLAAIGARGGRAGTGAAKARTTEQARAAGKARWSSRREKAQAALARVRAAESNPAMNRAQLLQAIDAWLYHATGAEVRRAWRARWGAMPGWAQA